MGKVRRANSRSVYQLKVTLREINPPVWRRILVPGNTKLPDLHLMLQAAMGWANGHLHKFTVDDIDYSVPDPDFEDDMEDEKRVRLDEVCPRPNTRFSYAYDFGDYWDHEIVVEEISPPERGRKYPACTAGARACPPEDCGGAWGYEEFLAAIRDPNHEEHAEMLEWVGGSFDPEAFDLDQLNQDLADYRLLDWESAD